MRPTGTFAIIAIGAALIASCGSGGGSVYPEGTVVVVSGECLSIEQVKQNIPAGLTPDDSMMMAKAYIRQWVDAKLVERVARDEVDMDEIDRLTHEYRLQLIMSHYRRAMAVQASDGFFCEDSIRAFYDANPGQFKLERPLIKGVYLKVPDDAENLRLLRRLYRSDKPTDMDQLEKAAASSAVHYDYFRDQWTDWEQVENRIPVDFGASRMQAIAQHKPLEVNVDGFVYLLSVSDFLPAGAPMPYQAARELVRDRLINRKRKLYDSKLRDDLFHTAAERGIVVFPSSNGKN